MSLEPLQRLRRADRQAPAYSLRDACPFSGGMRVMTLASSWGAALHSRPVAVGTAAGTQDRWGVGRQPEAPRRP
jgi:hypothetical protein